MFFLPVLLDVGRIRIRNRKNNDLSGSGGRKISDPMNPDRLHWLLLIRIHDTPYLDRAFLEKLGSGLCFSEA
jgi:hypothetical protein